MMLNGQLQHVPKLTRKVKRKLIDSFQRVIVGGALRRGLLTEGRVVAWNVSAEATGSPPLEGDRSARAALVTEATATAGVC